MSIRSDHIFSILVCLIFATSLVIIFTLVWLNTSTYNLSLSPREYSVLRDYIKPDEKPKWNITLTTHASPEFLYHIEELAHRWDSAISVAIYAPGNDFKMAYNTVEYLRKCNSNIRSQIQWHFIFDTRYPPAFNLSDAAQFIVSPFCNCDISLAQCIAQLRVQSHFRQRHDLTYPINIMRNAARKYANTKYVLASDAELYPSVNMPQTFFDLLAREENGHLPMVKMNTPHVYTLPIFEIKENLSVPRTKTELIQRFNSGDAIFFHQYICDECQKFPNRSNWVKQVPQDESLNIFAVTRRTHDVSSWEPIYISTNDVPFYDERLTWEGKLDKMGQMLEMCMLGYEMLVLDNAFLVHAPGIKRPNKKEDKRRKPFMSTNYMIHGQIDWELRHKYGPSDC